MTLESKELQLAAVDGKEFRIATRMGRRTRSDERDVTPPWWWRHLKAMVVIVCLSVGCMYLYMTDTLTLEPYTFDYIVGVLR